MAGKRENTRPLGHLTIPMLEAAEKALNDYAYAVDSARKRKNQRAILIAESGLKTAESLIKRLGGYSFCSNFGSYVTKCFCAKTVEEVADRVGYYIKRTPYIRK